MRQVFAAAFALFALGSSARGAALAHPQHTTDTPAHTALGCVECHACPGPTPIFGGVAWADGAQPSYDPGTATCAGTYCHGATLRSPPAQPPAWTDAAPTHRCDVCHGYPPPLPHPAMAFCRGCHGKTVAPDNTVDLTGGHHIDGFLDVSFDPTAGCSGCHGYPPSSGAHLAHFGLTDAAKSGQYGETTTLQDRFPAATPMSAPGSYAFGCGNCHPLDANEHLDGTVEVEVRSGVAPAGSLRARNSPTAAYDAAAGTCSGTYCHSSGQEFPTFGTSPAWTSTGQLGCGGCHANPPSYPSGGVGTSTANTHVVLADDGYESGHFGGIPGPWHGSFHGYGSGYDAAPITCQTCHFDTTDPTSTGPSGFYWLNTTGTYQLAGGDPGRIGSYTYESLQCTYCHESGGAAPTAAGGVRPLRHVNGARDVAFDPRVDLPAISWLPAAPNTPTQPYWSVPWNTAVPAGATRVGTGVSFGLGVAAYDAASKTCSSVACHIQQSAVQWGVSPIGWATCDSCHQYGGGY